MKVTYDFVDGDVVEIVDGEPIMCWSIYTVPDSVLREILFWNDKDGDFYELTRLQMLEIFLSDFVITRAK
jgi:hypothetical protein